RTDLSKSRRSLTGCRSGRLSVSADMRGNRRNKTSTRLWQPGLTLLLFVQFLSGNLLVADIRQFEQEVDDFVLEWRRWHGSDSGRFVAVIVPDLLLLARHHPGLGDDRFG